VGRGCSNPCLLAPPHGRAPTPRPRHPVDATKLPYPDHHLPGAKLVGFPMKPYALLHSRCAARQGRAVRRLRP
jgi:hypothetical protein